MPAWRNGQVRWTSNPKIVGLNPTVGAYYYILGKVEFQQVICFPWDCRKKIAPNSHNFRNNDRVERCVNVCDE